MSTVASSRESATCAHDRKRPSVCTLAAAVVAMTLVTTNAAAQSYVTYLLAGPAGCSGRVPDHPSVPVPRGLTWTGRCVNGWMHGPGETLRYKEGTLVEREIASFVAGVRNGPTTSYNVDSRSNQYGIQTYMRFSNGFPIGEIRMTAKDGRTLAVYEADGRGNVRQTSSPLQPLMSWGAKGLAEQYGGLILFLNMFAPEEFRVSGASIRACEVGLRAQGFSSDVTDFWCKALPSR